MAQSPASDTIIFDIEERIDMRVDGKSYHK